MLKAYWRSVVAVVFSVCGVVASGRADTRGTAREAVAAAVGRVLTSEAPGAALRRTEWDGARLTLDFSREFAATGLGSLEFERLSRAVHRAASDVLSAAAGAAHSDYEVFTQIEGVPLHVLLAGADGIAQAARAESGERIQQVATRRIAVSPGHGYYLNGNNYVLQRSYFQGIVEDFVNHDIVTLLAAALTESGSDVYPTRNLDRTAGNGETGNAKWQEAARYHVKAMGADASVWGESGFTHLEQDIRCRPRYANAINAEVMVSVHNNGGGGTGTETLYDTNNGWGTESKKLADFVHARVIGAIRRDYDPNWADRRVQGFNGSYGENRLATRPAILIEIAFMDRPTPDNAALQTERFKQLVATAIKDGIEDYLAGTAAPAAPTALIAGATPGAVLLGWRDASDNEASFRIERRTGAAGVWAAIGSAGANATSFKDTAASPGVSYGYRVVAINGRGASNASNETTVTAGPAAGDPAAWLSNVSLRTTLAPAQGVLVGFVVGGGQKEILLRAAGPALRDFGLSAVLAQPYLELFRGSTRVAEARGWTADTGTVGARLGAFPFAPSSADAALVRTLDGSSSAQVSGPGGGTVLVEAYDAGAGSAQRFINLSARNRVGLGDDALLAGFAVTGTGAQRFLVRAVGPGLTGFGVTGVLADPRVEVLDSAGVKIAENDNWEGVLAATAARLGAFPLQSGSRDAAVLVTLAAGATYSVKVSGVGTGTAATGEALVELYEVP